MTGEFIALEKVSNTNLKALRKSLIDAALKLLEYFYVLFTAEKNSRFSIEIRNKFEILMISGNYKILLVLYKALY